MVRTGIGSRSGAHPHSGMGAYEMGWILRDDRGLTGKETIERGISVGHSDTVFLKQKHRDFDLFLFTVAYAVRASTREGICIRIGRTRAFRGKDPQKVNKPKIQGPPFCFMVNIDNGMAPFHPYEWNSAVKG